MKDDFIVRRIEYQDCVEWCLYKHYAHRIPSISFAYGLYRVGGGQLEGICTFGLPPSPTLVQGSLGGKYTDSFLELNRLCVNEGLPKNALSFFVSQCLKLLPPPKVIVSYADTSMGHHGYIYQATNWIYTGLSLKKEDYVIEGMENKHNRHLTDVNGIKYTTQELREAFGDKIKKIERPRKHRYFYFVGNKREREEMKKSLTYPIVKEYPKGDNKRYDASYNVATQGILF